MIILKFQLRSDIDDINNLLKLAQRQKSKDALTLELRRVQTELSRELENSQKSTETAPIKYVPTAPKCYEVKIDKHGWDQTDKFVKIYIALKNVQSLPAESVVCNYTNRSVHLRVLGLDKKITIFWSTTSARTSSRKIVHWRWRPTTLSLVWRKSSLGPGRTWLKLKNNSRGRKMLCPQWTRTKTRVRV